MTIIQTYNTKNNNLFCDACKEKIQIKQFYYIYQFYDDDNKFKEIFLHPLCKQEDKNGGFNE